MATVIKPKRSETASSAPTTSDLVVGEVAVNTADKKIYVRDSGDNIVTVANFSVADASLIFPTGDYGSVADSAESDAFGQATSSSFDCLTTPTNALSTEDLGALS